MSSFIRKWMEAQEVATRSATFPYRPPHHNPTDVDSAGMDQRQTYGPGKPPYVQPVNWRAINELGELRRKLVHSSGAQRLDAEEQAKIRERIRELEQQASDPPDDALATYGVSHGKREIPVTEPQKGERDIGPEDVNTGK